MSWILWSKFVSDLIICEKTILVGHHRPHVTTSWAMGDEYELKAFRMGLQRQQTHLQCLPMGNTVRQTLSRSGLVLITFTGDVILCLRVFPRAKRRSRHVDRYHVKALFNAWKNSLHRFLFPV